MEGRLGAIEALNVALDTIETDLCNVDRTLAADDGMYAGNREHYFQVGRSALRVALLSLAAARFSQPVRSVLDLPCGHGRVLRALRHAFPQARITACDISRSGVDYCARAFGAVPVYSADDIGGVDLGGPFDLVWCGSLLTHLDAPKWEPFLAKFLSVLAPGGVAVVTTHGDTVLERAANGWNYGPEEAAMKRAVDAYRRDGFGYAEYPSTPAYGISLSSVSWVTARLSRRKGTRIVHVEERGWDDHQDVYAICRDEWKAPPGPESIWAERSDA